MSETTQTANEESPGVLDTLESKLDAFEERIGLRQYTTQAGVARGVVYYGFALTAVTPAAAQSNQLGSTLCNSDLMQLISNLLGILLTVGFLGGMYAVARSGMQYMNAGGDPEKKSQARESLVMSGFGLTLVIVVLLLPNFLNTLLTDSGLAGLSNCLKTPLSP